VGAVAVVGGGAALIGNANEAGAYDAAILDTWRHSFSFDPPLRAAQRELVRYATLAANNHNVQPWRFRLSDRSISVSPDFGRGLASVDPDNHDLFASLGCATENLVQAAQAFGLRATASFDAAAGGINVDLEKSPPIRSPLFEAIPLRQSTRSVFDPVSGKSGVLTVRIRRRPQGLCFAGVDDQRDSLRALINSTRVSTPKSVKARTPSSSRS
jgi:hypothetical protein